MQRVGGFCQREHHHLERDHHGKDTEIIYDFCGKAVDARDIPRRHRGAHENQRGGDDGDKKAVSR
ncbi:hypothetical protein SDC9_144328 [bioreactor metagenome]|uniref:Uncharacterized protein n=1 Tax=bioreactor metagenome TaxID=1076179 RepID=A0A645E6N2_9ZZZZ